MHLAQVEFNDARKLEWRAEEMNLCRRRNAQVDFNDAGKLKARVEEICMDTGSGKTSRRVIADIACDFPVVPAHLLGARLLVHVDAGSTIWLDQPCKCIAHMPGLATMLGGRPPHFVRMQGCTQAHCFSVVPGHPSVAALPALMRLQW